MLSSFRHSKLGFATKQAVFQLLGNEALLRQRRRRIQQSGAVTILNLHRVADHDRSGYPPLDPKLFDELLAYVAARFSVIGLDDIAAPSSKPKLILSFDDGYKDFIEVAAPILRKHRLRANQNVVPACIESGLPPLNVIAQDFIGRAPLELVRKLDVPGFAIAFTPDLAHRLSFFLKTKPHDRQQALAAHLLPQFFNWAEFRPTPVMSREDVRQIAAEHDVGAHSYEHGTMEQETEEYFAADVSRCIDYFDRSLDLPMEIYAFPNGSHRPRHIDILRGAGMKHVLLVGESFSTDENIHSRFTFHATTMAEARFRTHGGLAAMP